MLTLYTMLRDYYIISMPIESPKNLKENCFGSSSWADGARWFRTGAVSCRTVSSAGSFGGNNPISSSSDFVTPMAATFSDSRSRFCFSPFNYVVISLG